MKEETYNRIGILIGSIIMLGLICIAILSRISVDVGLAGDIDLMWTYYGYGMICAGVVFFGFISLIVWHIRSPWGI